MLLLGGIGAAVIGLSFIEREEYQPLFIGLTTEDASNVVSRLKEQKIPYKLGASGTTVSVPKEKLSDVRLVLASQNALPGGGGVGLELFDKTNYGMTEFMQTVNYKRAIQGEADQDHQPDARGEGLPHTHSYTGEVAFHGEGKRGHGLGVPEAEAGQAPFQGTGGRRRAARCGQHRGTQGGQRSRH